MMKLYFEEGCIWYNYNLFVWVIFWCQKKWIMTVGKLCMQEQWVEFSLYCITEKFCSQTFMSTEWGGNIWSLLFWVWVCLFHLPILCCPLQSSLYTGPQCLWSCIRLWSVTKSDKNKLEVQTFLQHLCDVLKLVKKPADVLLCDMVCTLG
jgi:hypothetical protein